ncbi:hypothetical protein [Agrobacterium bohemicum]|uniref:Uncharacterized protein n=1 Tax=Agrobacterium bohemicum TaxID=2052828 RepID=A0A135P833_9HYPH|nr:hypothetical protein [Agrobacterium bohemicum]KXG87587.1 hypothetical protein ATO67_18235 [Agrobacterium bohemicum]
MNRNEYQRDVCARSGEALNVPFNPDVTIGDWKPQPSECHQNVDYYVQHHRGYVAVRGWLLLLVFGEQKQYTPHSVVRCPEGNLFDITPVRGQTPVHRWFITHVENEQLFHSMSQPNYPIQCLGCTVAPPLSFEQLCQMQDVETASHRRDC